LVDAAASASDNMKAAANDLRDLMGRFIVRRAGGSPRRASLPAPSGGFDDED
jgi:hypothetical protein